jgi:nucleoside-diphosphate-sugar epimerase
MMILKISVVFYVCCHSYDYHHLVTGCAGYLGKELCHTIVDQSILEGSVDAEATAGVGHHSVIGFVRRSKVDQEQLYWGRQPNANVEVHDINDFEQCLSKLQSSSNSKIIVYCVAANFKPAAFGDDEATNTDLALESVALTESIVRASCRSMVDRIVLTSSMAAVRGPQQSPLNGQHFTSRDWNTAASGLDERSFSACYQWSKAEGERRAWEIVSMYNHAVPLVSLCPSMILGPIRDASQIGQSIRLLMSWMDGSRPIESRLFVDVRDVALAHYRASQLPLTGSRRYIISHERRVPASMVMSYLVEAVRGCSDRDVSGKNGCMRCDDKFVGGGLIPVGNREVEASHPMLQDLGIECRSVQDTIRDAVYSMCVPDSVTVTDIK